MAGNPSLTDNTMMYGAHSGMAGLYKLQTGWTSPPTSIDGSMSRGQSISSGLALMGVDGGPVSQVDPSMTAEVYGPGIPWTPPSDISTPFTETFTIPNPLSQGHSRSHSYDVRASAMSWTDTTVPDLSAFNQASTPVSVSTVSSNFFPSPTATPNLRPTQPRPKSTPASTAGGSCTCFTVCLQSLQALHNASSPASPPFDLVLSLNRKAVEGLLKMHEEIRNPHGCYAPGDRDRHHNLLLQEGVSVLLRPRQLIIKWQPSKDNPSSNDDNNEDSRWLELEILARELRKLEEVYANFREVCSELSEDPDVSRAMISYLGQSLGSTMQVVSHHRNGDMMFS
ncbi:hypothetical protein VPNG_06937 [Cytospora leucostoma]|uniref:Aflatoxin regulatory protein domain-containing protein n=1 Tax=Cytospora leucostoma TaxID=1230097 RepID=A0A423WXA5_9PEZI|nr:hypothetical protein VPNG_06937 [Cytospora leucostoma]